MATLITLLRGLCDAGTADYSLGTATYWTDDQLQSLLDRYRRLVEGLVLVPTEYSTVYRYDVPFAEAAQSGVLAWSLVNPAGEELEDYTVNYDAGEITFAEDYAGDQAVLRCRTYDLMRAAAEVWRTKAGHVASRFDVTTGGSQLSRAQLRESYLAMAAHYARIAPPRSTRMERIDVDEQ